MNFINFAQFKAGCEVGETGVFRFPKSERLHHRSLVDMLFRKGKSFYEFPFRVTWRVISQDELKHNFRDHVPSDISVLQMLVTVPKKKRRKAVDRVLMRRRIREAYRLHRRDLRSCVENLEGLGTLSLAIVYIHDKNIEYNTVEEKMKHLLSKLQAKLAVQE